MTSSVLSCSFFRFSIFFSIMTLVPQSEKRLSKKMSRARWVEEMVSRSLFEDEIEVAQLTGKRVDGLFEMQQRGFGGIEFIIFQKIEDEAAVGDQVPGRNGVGGVEAADDVRECFQHRETGLFGFVRFAPFVLDRQNLLLAFADDLVHVRMSAEHVFLDVAQPQFSSLRCPLRLP